MKGGCHRDTSVLPLDLGDALRQVGRFQHLTVRPPSSDPRNQLKGVRHLGRPLDAPVGQVADLLRGEPDRLADARCQDRVVKPKPDLNHPLTIEDAPEVLEHLVHHDVFGAFEAPGRQRGAQDAFDFKHPQAGALAAAAYQVDAFGQQRRLKEVRLDLVLLDHRPAVSLIADADRDPLHPALQQHLPHFGPLHVCGLLTLGDLD